MSHFFKTFSPAMESAEFYNLKEKKLKFDMFPSSFFFFFYLPPLSSLFVVAIMDGLKELEMAFLGDLGFKCNLYLLSELAQGSNDSLPCGLWKRYQQRHPPQEKTSSDISCGPIFPTSSWTLVPFPEPKISLKSLTIRPFGDIQEWLKSLPISDRLGGRSL